MSLSYQLTKHPVGSKREFWALSWPLMIGLVATSFMFFVDRLFLARYDPLALNASVTAGLAYWMFLVIPMGIAAIAEVLVGRLHGEGKWLEAGRAAMQMVWFILFIAPLFWLLAIYGPPMLFFNTGNEALEGSYFTTLTFFAPAHCINIALSGFFIGLGKVRIVTIAALVGNFVNIALDYALIFGWGPFPEMGITGAAIATGLSEVSQGMLLSLIFWSRSNRKAFGTNNVAFERAYFFEGLKIGAPTGLGRFVEVLGHFVFMRIVLWTGADQMALVSMVQSIYIFVAFVVDAESKGASAIIANLLGAGVRGPINRVLRSSFVLHILYSLGLTLVILPFSNVLFDLFNGDSAALSSPVYRETFLYALVWMCFFFLLDGFVWIFSGFLTAAGDTRFLLAISLLVNWIAYVLPAYWFVGVQQGNAATAFAVIACMNCVNFVVYAWRYRSGGWLQSYRAIKA